MTQRNADKKGDLNESWLLFLFFLYRFSVSYLRSSATSADEFPSSHQFLHHPAVHVRQPEIAAGVAVGEFFVVEAEEVEDRGVEVVDVDPVVDGGEAELVG